MSTSVKDILNKQKEETDAQVEANKYLSLLNDVKSYTEDLLLEQMITNEDQLTSANGTLSEISKSLKGGVTAIISSLGNLKMPEMEEVGESISASDMFKSMEAKNKEIADSIQAQTIAQEKIIKQNDQAQKSFDDDTSFKASFADALTLFGKKNEVQLQEVPKIEMPDNLDPTEFYDQLDDNTEKMLFHLMSIDKMMAEEVRMRKSASVTDIGTASSLKGEDEKEIEGGGMLETLSSMFGFKMPAMPKGLGKIMKGVKGLGRVLGKVAIVVGAVIAVFDFIKGAFDGDTLKSITGKNKEDLSIVERIMSGISNVIEGLTFGLVSAKSVFEFAKPLTQGLSDMIEFLFDPKTGTFADFIKGFTDIYDQFSNGNIIDGFVAIAKNVVMAPINFLKGIAGTVGGMFSSDGIFSFIGDMFDSETGMFSSLTKSFMKIKEDFEAGNYMDMLWSGLKAIIMAPINFFSSIGSKIGDFIMEMVPESMRKFFGKRGKEIDQAKAFIGDTASSIGDSVGSFLGFGDDKNEVKDQSSVVKPTFDRAIRQPSDNSARAIPVAVNNQSVELSKARMDEQKVTVTQPQPQPIIVQSPPQEKTSVVRRSSVDDTSLATVNAGMWD